MLAQLPQKLQRGFTVIEVSVVVAIMGIMVGLSIVSLTPLIPRSNLRTSVNNLVSDLSFQQHKAMVGESNGAGIRPAFGVHFQEDRYTMFEGITYSAASPDNIEIVLPDNVQFSNINIPNDTIVFATVSGEVQNFNASENSVTVTSSVLSDQAIITFNQLGVITSL